jgi:probable phosphoglycerate mutase
MCGSGSDRLLSRIARRSRGKALIVGHAGVNRVIVCRVLGMPLANVLRREQTPAAVSILSIRPDGLRLKAMNLTLDRVPADSRPAVAPG